MSSVDDDVDAFFKVEESKLNSRDEDDGDDCEMELLEDDVDFLGLSDDGAHQTNGKGKARRNPTGDAYLKKKEYNKRRNRMLREAEKNEVMTLRKQATELEVLIKDLVARRGGAGVATEMLPWKDVAGIFSQMKATSEKEKAQLFHKVKSYRDVAFVMHQWVNSNHHLPVMPDPFKQTWRNSALVAHEGSRALGFDWIAKQLYYNIDTMIAHCGLPPSLDTCNEVKVYQLENLNSYHLSKARQRIEHASLEEVMQVLRRQYFENTAETLDSPDANVRYFRLESAYGNTAHNSYTQNILMRQFEEANRYVLFAHSITEDEKFPVDRIQRNWTNWTVAERLDSNMTIIKQMSVATGLRMNEVFLPFDNDPHNYDPTMDPDMAFRQFESKTQAYHKYIFAKEIATFRDLLAQVREENTEKAELASRASTFVVVDDATGPL
ncbi:Aste57867_8664 [Aphanomyces stellatus]|uniref:Aste57867_8664 protein n=1 Tax=Aphanomyces stellatus TaxID=120398 RepID=A0A485KL08_9STRA|nr:hypothetical protein As57867_008630 [Aphanomyces stellatus]VFT85550.1 Aste57867_8664 [Aphanomyces stellatus]